MAVCRMYVVPGVLFCLKHKYMYSSDLNSMLLWAWKECNTSWWLTLAYCCYMQKCFQEPQTRFDWSLWKCVQLACFDLTHSKPEGNLNYMCGWCKWQPPTALISNCFSKHIFPQHTILTSPPLVINTQEYIVYNGMSMNTQASHIALSLRETSE